MARNDDPSLQPGVTPDLATAVAFNLPESIVEDGSPLTYRAADFKLTGADTGEVSEAGTITVYVESGSIKVERIGSNGNAAHGPGGGDRWPPDPTEMSPDSSEIIHAGRYIRFKDAVHRITNADRSPARIRVVRLIATKDEQIECDSIVCRPCYTYPP